MPRRAVPILLALATLAFAIPLAWTGATPVTNACDAPVQGDERSETDSHTSVWPPGVRCVYRPSDGRTSETTYITWYELTLALLAGVVVWLACAAALGTCSRRQLMLGASGVVFLFVAANVAFFL